MKFTVQKWGNSAAIRLPSILLTELSFGIGDQIEINPNAIRVCNNKKNEDIALKSLIFPGFNGEPKLLNYSLLIKQDSQEVRIITYQTPKDIEVSLINNSKFRNLVLNKIINNDLTGVSIDRIRFFVTYGKLKESSDVVFEYEFKKTHNKDVDSEMFVTLDYPVL